MGMWTASLDHSGVAISAIEWLIDRSQVRRTRRWASSTTPTIWGREIADPRYIIDLFARIATVSLHTMRIVDSPPALAIFEDQKGTSP